MAGVRALLDRFDTLRLVEPVAARPSGTVMRGPIRLPVALA